MLGTLDGPAIHEEMSESRREPMYAYFFLMRVSLELDAWPEMARRARCWVSLERARALAHRPLMQHVLLRVVEDASRGALAIRRDA